MDLGKTKTEIEGLPIIPADRQPNDNETWSCIDGGAEVVVTRELLPLPGNIEVFCVNVLGTPDERYRVMLEFCELYGSPVDLELNPEMPEYAAGGVWLVPGQD